MLVKGHESEAGEGEEHAEMDNLVRRYPQELFLHLGDGGKVGETEHQDRDQIARQQDPGP